MISMILTVMWWIYVLIMSPAILFNGGFVEFVMGLFIVALMLLFPMVFHKNG